MQKAEEQGGNADARVSIRRALAVAEHGRLQHPLLGASPDHQPEERPEEIAPIVNGAGHNAGNEVPATETAVQPAASISGGAAKGPPVESPLSGA